LPERELADLERIYREDTEWLFTVRRFGSKLGLEYVSHLLAQLGDPQNDFRSIHVTGTSGKGSTTAMVASILREAGFGVGMFTSPHLTTFTERIQINGRRIPVEEVVRLVDVVRPLCEAMAEDPLLRHPTFFEIVTAMAFKYFSEEKVEFAVLEVGMGGRLDATNVVKSLVSVITNVSLEHTEVLGDTVLEIAEKKAGIIKEGGVLVTATTDEEVYDLFRRVCEEVGSRIFRVGDDLRFEKILSNQEGQRFRLEGLFDTHYELSIPLLGEHQLLNAATAVGAVEALRFHGVDVPPDAVERGLANVCWPGRMEVVQARPTVVLDGAKDEEAARAVKETLLSEFKYERRVAVVSMSSDKKITGMIEQLAQAVDYFVVTAHGVMGRAADPSLIAKELERLSKGHEIVEDVKDAVRKAIDLAGEDGMVIVVGSVFLVGEARELWHEPDDPLIASKNNKKE
jgi:dihydrofolate synthase/folylpolyglutamate synthase